MIITIVGRGPGHERARRADLMVGINHVAALYCCDWWCFGDMETWRDVKPLGNPRWATNENAFRRIVRRGPTSPDAMIWETLAGPRDVNWHVFSATAALVLAKSLGAIQIECCGVVDELPMAGESQRWVTERTIWNGVVNWLGIPVVRV